MKTKTKKSQRAVQVYNTLPVKVTRKEFNRYIKPNLSKGTRGKKPKVSQWKIFNYILYVLHTGIPWYTLPVCQVHWSNIYKQFNRWSKDGSLEKIFTGSLQHLTEQGLLDMSVLHGDGSNVVAKKGLNTLATQDTNISEVKNLLILKTILVMSLFPVSLPH